MRYDRQMLLAQEVADRDSMCLGNALLFHLRLPLSLRFGFRCSRVSPYLPAVPSRDSHAHACQAKQRCERDQERHAERCTHARHEEDERESD